MCDRVDHYGHVINRCQHVLVVLAMLIVVVIPLITTKIALAVKVVMAALVAVLKINGRVDRGGHLGQPFLCSLLQ